jgi:adenine-specific DNA-methyltransferase
MRFARGDMASKTKAKTRRTRPRRAPLPRRRTTKASERRERKARPRVLLHRGDAIEFLRALKPGSVDLIISSPPYCMGKEYERTLRKDDFITAHMKIAPLLTRALRSGGSLCWQVGHHVHAGIVTPLDAIVYHIFSEQKKLLLRNRIVWTFGHGAHASKRFSGRHETILWFTKGHRYRFDLNSIRVPQKYPGKRHYKGPNKGQFSGNPRGKNPSDVWEIPNVKSKHIEKTDHPCQFPVALVQRLIRALVRRNGLVVDPFMGSGSAAVAAALEGRSFEGCDIKSSYVRIAKKRMSSLKRGEITHRPLERPIFTPNGNDSVSTRPIHFWTH